MNLAKQYHRDWVPTDLKGCQLYLPVWRYGAQAQKWWDQSGQGNHGTISGCLTRESLVYGPVGPIPISDVKPGDCVFTYKGGEIATSKVTHFFDNGIKPVYKVNLTNHSVMATSNHPFLTAVWNGQEEIKGYRNNHPFHYKQGKWDLRWLPVSGLTPGMQIVSLYKAPNDHPPKKSKAFMRLVGCFIGDGSSEDYRIVLSLEKESEQSYYTNLLEQFGYEVIACKKGLKICSRKLVVELEELGLRKKCLEKDIPGWVWLESEDNIKELILGFADADGCERRANGEIYAYSLSGVNKKLIHQLQGLCDYVGWRTSNIQYRRRSSKINGRSIKEGDEYSFDVYVNSQRTIQNRAEMGSIKRRIGIDLPNNFEFQRVSCVEYMGEEPTYDISVKDSHNFIANGIVVHNSVPYPGNPQITGVGSTYNRGDFTATNAFFWSSIDLSTFSGTDLGSTPYRIEVLDAAGKKATGYLAGVGAGETLGSELIINGTMELDSNWENWGTPPTNERSTEQVYAGTYSRKWIGNSGHGIKSDIFTVELNMLYKFSKWVYPASTTSYKVTVLNGAGTFDINAAMVSGLTQNSWNATDNYYTCTAGGTGAQAAILSTGTSYTYYADNVSDKHVTDPPSTAVHIVSSLNGMTRAWESIESGFNPNTITSWKINSVIPRTCIGWYFDDVDDKVVHSSINFGKTHTLLYWLRSFNNAQGIIHGGAANYQVSIGGTNLYYNAGATELSQAHGGGMSRPTMIGIVRSGTTVQFFKNGVQVGTDQTLDANNDLTLTTLGSYGTPGTFLGGVILDNKGFTRAFSAQEMKSYFDNTRHVYGT